MTKKSKHFIPSPYKVVTEYENEFIDDWNKNLSLAVNNVLKYIAKETANAIKKVNNIDKSLDIDIEKAHNIGDEKVYQGITYYVSGFNSKHIPLWRKKDKKKKKIGSNNDIDKIMSSPEIEKLNTLKYTAGFSVWAYDNKITDSPYADNVLVDVKSLRLIYGALYYIKKKYNFQPIKIRILPLDDKKTMCANGSIIEINSKFFCPFDPIKYWNNTHIKYKERQRDATIEANEEIKKIVKEFSLENPGKELPDYQKNYDNLCIYNLVKRYKEFPCWTYHSKDSVAADLVIHELGHVLNGQCTGAIGYGVINRKERTDEYNKMADSLNEERDKIFKRYCEGGKIISEYSTYNPDEFFAECFVAYVHKDKKLPDYISKYFDKYFSKTKPLR